LFEEEEDGAATRALNARGAAEAVEERRDIIAVVAFFVLT
jgi:hypothetical protein